MKKIKELMPEAYDFNGKLSLKQAIPLGLQHVMAMFVGNLTPLLIITGACGIGAGSEYASIQVALLQNAMIIAGIVTLIQLFSVGPVGGKVPIIMGTSSGFIGVFSSVTKVMGGGILAYGAIMGASIIGGLFETVLGAFIKPLRRFFPSVVTGTVVLSIGLSLISVGINSFGGGNGAKDFGSLENLFLAFVVLIVILFVKHWTKGYLSSSSILIGIIVGYIVAVIMGCVLPHTAVTADGVEYTKSWVLNWNKVAEAKWIAIPKFMPVKPVFDLRAILPVLVMFVVTAVETVGDISGVMVGGVGREATDKELSGGVMCDGLGSSLAALFGVLWANMKMILAETVKYADMVIFNRCKTSMELGSYRRSMKALNSYVQIVFEDKNGDMMSIAEQLPYDVNANVIEVDDCDYGIWYMDVSERPEVYKGKTVRFKGQVLKNKYFKDKNFVPGRKVMTCCAEDTSFIGYISFYDKISSLENRQWITVTAQIAYEFQMAYKKKGPVLYVQKVEPAEAPEDELVYF